MHMDDSLLDQEFFFADVKRDRITIAAKAAIRALWKDDVDCDEHPKSSYLCMGSAKYCTSDFGIPYVWSTFSQRPEILSQLRRLEARSEQLRSPDQWRRYRRWRVGMLRIAKANEATDLNSLGLEVDKFNRACLNNDCYFWVILFSSNLKITGLLLQLHLFHSYFSIFYFLVSSFA